jgi:hypothetical protein
MCKVYPHGSILFLSTGRLRIEQISDLYKDKKLAFPEVGLENDRLHSTDQESESYLRMAINRLKDLE